MSVGRPTSSIVFSPEAYEANRARIEAAKAVIQAAELENEEGRKNHEQMEAELRAKIQEGDEARRALAQLEASRKHLATQNTPALVPSPAITVPLGNDATEPADTSRIEEIHSHDATYSTAPQIQTSWSGSVAQNGSYTTNNVASYSAQSSSNTHVASHSSTAGYRGGNPYAVLSSNPLSQTPVQHVARHHYGSVHQPYSQAQYQGSSRNYQYNYSQPESQSMHSSHYASVIPLSNQETEQSARHYSGSTHHYNSQQSQQYLNKSHEVTGTAHPSVLAAATAIGRQRMYQPPSGSSSLEGALTPAGQSNVQVAPHHTTGNNKQSQAPSSTLNPSSSNTFHQTELSNSLHIQPTSGASQVSSSYTAAALNHYSTSSQSSRPPLTTLLEKARDYVRRFANDWDITAKPNSFTIIPQLPSYKLYKGHDLKLRVAVQRNELTELISLDKFSASELPRIMANFAQRLQADIQHATSATTSNPSSQNMQSRPAAIPSTAIKSSNNLVAPRLVSPNNLATSSINLGPSSTTPVITVPPAPSTPGTSFASGSTAFSSSVADLSRMPDPTLLSTQLNPSRTPAQADKRHLARDILRALKRPLVSDSFERESKRHASESRVLTERNNDEIKEISNSVGEPAIAATTTSEMDLSNSVPTLLNDAQRTESVVTQPQPSSIATSIHATLSVQKSSIPPANVVNEAMSSQLSPSPRLSSTTLESNEKKSQSHEVLTTHDVPGAPQPHDVIVIEDSPSGSSGSPEDLNANDISDTAIEYHQAIQRPMSPEIPVPSPNIKGNNTFSTLSPPSVEPSLPKESDGTNPPMPADPVLKETAKRRKLVPYVLVPPPPEYARRHKEWVGRSSSMLKLDSRTQVKGVDDRNTAIDFQVEALPPFTYDESEREAVRVSCTRLRESPCKWIGCGIVLNSAQGLIVHLKAEHIPLSSANSPFTCFWKGCGHRCAEDRTSLGHVERHALASLLCAYEGCNESFRGPRQLVKHNELHRYSSLKPAVDLKPIKTSKSLPTCPGVIPVTMIETAAINVPSLSESRHAALAPLVLKNISGPVHLKTERYNTIRKPLRASKFGKNEEEDGSDNYELLITGASSKHYASILSSPAKIRGQIASIHSEDVTQMAHDGLVLWGPPTEKESPPATPRLVSGFSNELGSDDADEEVRPEEFDNLELKRWDPLPDSISTSRPDTGSSEEEVVESMLAVE